MDISRRVALTAAFASVSALVVLPAAAQPSPKGAPKAPSEAAPPKAPSAGAPKQSTPESEPGTLEKPVLFDISTTSGSLKESVQNGQELIWHRKGQPAARFFQVTNIAVGLLRSETGGQLTVTFSCNTSSLGFMMPEEAKLNMILRTKGGAALHSWAFGIPVKCTDKNQSLPPQTHEVPKEIAVNVFTNTYSIEIAEYSEPNLSEQKAQRCD